MLIDRLATACMKIRPGVLAVLLFAASCSSSGVSLSLQEIDNSYSPGEFAYSSAGRDTRVLVAGVPFAGDHPNFGKTVTDAMQGQHWGQKTNFTTTPGPSVRNSYRVVMLFNPPRNLNGMRLCDTPAAELPAEPPGDVITLYGAFCREKKSLTEIKGRAAGITSPDDPRFGALVGRVTNGLFPPNRDLDRDRGGCPIWRRCR